MDKRNKMVLVATTLSLISEKEDKGGITAMGASFIILAETTLEPTMRKARRALLPMCTLFAIY